jgi:phosphoribosylglycinamide formyltransferase 1
MRKARVGVLISGRGSNMQALVEAGQAPDYPAEVVLVASNRPDAEGLRYARSVGLATAVVDHRDHQTREAFDAALLMELDRHDLDLICCAGFMRIMTPVLTGAWSGRMLNIHPSLLPLYKGLNTHARALADGAKEHGAAVHFVTDELDAGDVIVQAKVPVHPDDTPETLAARVLAVEHPLYVEALQRVASALPQREINQD